LRSCQERTYEQNWDELVREQNPTGVLDFPRRLDRFGRSKERAARLAAWMDTAAADPARFADSKDLRRRARKLCQCGSWLHFRHFPTVDLVKLQNGRFCQQDRLCGNCARRRGAKALRRHVERVLHVVSEQPHLRGYLGTWTAKNRANLRDMHDHVWGAMQRAIGRRRSYLHDPSRNQYTELAKIAGGTISGETKRGENSGLWHEHIHGMLLCESEPDVQQLRAEWQELTGDSFVVDVRPFHYVRDGQPPTAENLAGDFVEVFKYAVKLQDLDLGDNWDAHRQLFGARMLRSFGCMHGVKLPEDLLDDDLEDEDLPYVDWFYRYGSDGRGYQLEHDTADYA
jgi:hypothetical protein